MRDGGKNSYNLNPERREMNVVGVWTENNRTERLYGIPYQQLPPGRVTHIVEVEREDRYGRIQRELYPLSENEAREWIQGREVFDTEEEMRLALEEF